VSDAATTTAAHVPAAPETGAGLDGAGAPSGPGEQTGAAASDDRAALLEEGRRALSSGDYSRSIQLFTKILQQGGDEIARTAQELLGIARERNGQLAHAKAVYEEYLRQYPDGEGSSRVRQRLAVLTASAAPIVEPEAAGASAARAAAAESGAHRWFANTSLWQYYRRQLAQANDTPELLSQSSLLSNVDLSVRRNGELMDLQSRIAAGYWYDFLGEEGPGNELDLYYAYVEADGRQGRWRTRLGRQSRGVAGLLGRYDGVIFSYDAAERITLNVVGGYPIYSTRDSFDRTRVFEGLSIDFDDVASGWDLSAFYNQQSTAGILDRRAIGVESRWFDERRGLYTQVDYDLSYSTLNNIYLVGNWRTQGRLTLNATLNRSHSPFLTTSNALIGQPLTSIEELLAFETEEQIRQLALDRTATSTTYSAGVSRPLFQKLQLDFDVTSTSYSSTIASGGVDALPASDYKYYSVSLLAQSLLKEGDMGIFTLRFGDTTSYRVSSLSLDMRYPLRALRINPRLRVDRRTQLLDGSSEWIYTPMLRMQYQWRRHYYFECEAGMYLSDRALDGTSDEFRTTFFIGAVSLHVLLATCSACAGGHGELLRQHLDERTALVLTGLGEPLVLYREQPQLAAHARDYVQLGPLEVNRQGNLTYYLWMGIWSTIDRGPGSDEGAKFDHVYLFVDGEPMELALGGSVPPFKAQDLRFYDKPVRSTVDAFYAVTADQLRRLGGAKDVYLVLGTDERGRYDTWKWNSIALSAFAQYTDDHELR
jgi:hypothetical protein